MAELKERRKEVKRELGIIKRCISESTYREILRERQSYKIMEENRECIEMELLKEDWRSR